MLVMPDADHSSSSIFPRRKRNNNSNHGNSMMCPNLSDSKIWKTDRGLFMCVSSLKENLPSIDVDIEIITLQELDPSQCPDDVYVNELPRSDDECDELRWYNDSHDNLRPFNCESIRKCGKETYELNESSRIDGKDTDDSYDSSAEPAYFDDETNFPNGESESLKQPSFKRKIFERDKNDGDLQNIGEENSDTCDEPKDLLRSDDGRSDFERFYDQLRLSDFEEGKCERRGLDDEGTADEHFFVPERRRQAPDSCSDSEEEEEPVFRCGECGYSSQIRFHYDVHMMSHAGTEKPFTCEGCNKQFKRETSLKIHEQSCRKKLALVKKEVERKEEEERMKERKVDEGQNHVKEDNVVVEELDNLDFSCFSRRKAPPALSLECHENKAEDNVDNIDLKCDEKSFIFSPIVVESRKDTDTESLSSQQTVAEQEEDYTSSSSEEVMESDDDTSNDSSITLSENENTKDDDVENVEVSFSDDNSDNGGSGGDDNNVGNELDNHSILRNNTLFDDGSAGNPTVEERESATEKNTSLQPGNNEINLTNEVLRRYTRSNTREKALEESVVNHLEMIEGFKDLCSPNTESTAESISGLTTEEERSLHLTTESDEDTISYTSETEENEDFSGDENGGFTSDDSLPTIDGEFRCDICSRTFACSFTLQRHKLRHSAVKSFQCGTCLRRFIYRSDLMKHSVDCDPDLER